MEKWIGYQKGVNLGGWLSQCVHTKEHYDTFISKDDIKVLAGWGLDHLRLPIDYNLVQAEDGSFIESGFSYIDNCIEWCGEYELNMVLDLHKTAGFSFDEGEGEFGFFESEKLLDRFVELWDELAKRYAKYSDRMAFELLNEVVEPADNEPWMKVAKRAVDKIRGYSKDIKILIGSYYNNSVTTVKHIAMPFDENIVYNFHCYEPLLFTHQGAYWIKTMPLDFRIHYPMTKEEYFEGSAGKGETFSLTDKQLTGDKFTSAYFENIFEEAINVANERGVMLYCGEYGVIDLADKESTLAWYKDIHAVFEKYGIGHSAWSYKKMDFGLSDERMDDIRDEIIKYL